LVKLYQSVLQTVAAGSVGLGRQAVGIHRTKPDVNGLSWNQIGVLGILED
jgi:hypothetical protein